VGPQLILVHGVGAGEREALLVAWKTALADGARRAGHSDFAARLVRDADLKVDMAFYADLFTVPHAQGTADAGLDEDSLAVLADLLVDIAEGQADAHAEQRVLALARAQLTGASEPQGMGDLLRRCLGVTTALLSLPGFRRAGQWTGDGAMRMVGDLGQAARYLARGETDRSGLSLDRRIRDRFLSHIDGPAVVVAHSLGSIVAWEALHQIASEVSLFVTIGSPLALRSAVQPRLRPQPLWVPESVGRWLNFWDRDDPLVARPRLEEVFGRNSRRVRPESSRVDADGNNVHAAVKYLEHADIAGPMAEAMR
jgi:hypothetical protein